MKKPYFCDLQKRLVKVVFWTKSWAKIEWLSYNDLSISIQPKALDAALSNDSI